MFTMDDSEEHIRDLTEKYSAFNQYVDGILEKMTPEQWLKMAVISSVVQPDHIAEAFSEGLTVDEMFVNLAERMYPSGDVQTGE